MKLNDEHPAHPTWHDPFDRRYVKSMAKAILSPLAHRYFHAEMHGFETLPTRPNPDKPLLFASNHSGMAFPWDAIIFESLWLERFDFDVNAAPRPLAAPMLSGMKFMAPYELPNFWRKAGCIDANTPNFEAMMEANTSDVLVYPEGVPGIGKGFNRKYQLQRFSSSIVRMAVKHQTDIIPVATVNAEYINPLSFSFDSVDRFVQKLGLPFLPLGPLLALIPIQPWIFYMALPARLTYVAGAPIKVYEWVKDPDSLTLKDYRELAERVRQQMQEHLDDSVTRYGQNPYEKPNKPTITTKASSGGWWKFVPFFWPLWFWGHRIKYDAEPDAHEAHANPSFWELIQALIRKPRLLAYYLPVIGLIVLGITGGKKRQERGPFTEIPEFTTQASKEEIHPPAG